MTEAMVHRDKCKHFNGVQRDCCKAGVRYDDVALSADEHPRRRLPCADFGTGVRVPDTCPARAFLTEEEHAEREREVNEAVSKMLAAHAAGKCHICGADVEPSRVIGRCKYGACGHRLGQVGGRHG